MISNFWKHPVCKTIKRESVRSLIKRCPNSGKFQNLLKNVSLEIFSGRICQCPPAVKVWKSSGPSLSMRRANNSCLFCFEILVKQVCVFQHALLIAIPKPKKLLGDPKSYKPISLLFFLFRILERLIYARVEPLIDILLPREQAGFWRGRSAVDPVTLLTQ